jgi:hypothetical protein
MYCDNAFPENDVFGFKAKACFTYEEGWLLLLLVSLVLCFALNIQVCQNYIGNVTFIFDFLISFRLSLIQADTHETLCETRLYFFIIKQLYVF